MNHNTIDNTLDESEFTFNTTARDPTILYNLISLVPKDLQKNIVVYKGETKELYTSNQRIEQLMAMNRTELVGVYYEMDPLKRESLLKKN